MVLEFTIIPYAYLGTAIVLTFIAFVISSNERNALRGFINPFVIFLKWLLISVALLMIILNIASMKLVIDNEFNETNSTLREGLSRQASTAFSVTIYSHMFIMLMLFVMFILTLFEYLSGFVKKP